MVSMLFGIMILSSAELLNVLLSMLFKLLPGSNVHDFKDLQLLKAEEPKVSTLFGIMILSSPVPEKQELPIELSVLPSSKATDVNPEQ